MAVEGFASLAAKQHRYESRYQLIWSIGAMAIFHLSQVGDEKADHNI